MKTKIAKFLSIVTVAPVVAAIALTWLYVYNSSYFNNSIYWYIMSMVFMTLIPISSYGLKYLIPSIRVQGRKGERKLSFIMAVAGYVFGTIFCFALHSPKIVEYVFLSYLVSGVVLSFVNKVIKVKASGHACGVSGPLTILLFFVGRKAIYALILLPVIFWARINLGRHTLRELITGTFVGAFSTAIVLLVFPYFIH